MKKVIHIEDKPEWQTVVKNALMLNTGIEPVTAYGSMEAFREANYPEADLYVCDRHLPERKGGDPDDQTWRSLLKTLSCLYSHSPVIILSNYPPADRRNFRNVVECIQKPRDLEQFDFQHFRSRVEYYLRINDSGDSL